MRSPNRALAPLVLLLALSLAPPASAEEPDSPSVIPPDVGAIEHRTYAEWSAKWWRQGFALPRSSSPFLEEGRANCGLGEDDVRFLYGTFTTTTQPSGDVVGVARRRCTIEEDTRLFLPSLNGECSTAEGDGTTEAELRACAAAQGDFIAGGERRLTVDGVELPTYRVASPLFTFDLPPDNILGLAPQRSLSVADGFFAMLDDLEERRRPYVVEFGGSLTIPASPPNPAFTFTTTVTYRITVRDD